jgi:hypothetical protein
MLQHGMNLENIILCGKKIRIWRLRVDLLLCLFVSSPIDKSIETKEISDLGGSGGQEGMESNY